ncbi:MAG TPA: SCO2521 family protein [Micromonosporaceae bacterium]|nr:SCO2521 family protein [Micromonosporaceae bacterium]
MLIVGEIHTGLLQNSVALPLPTCERALGLVHGERVRQFERPIAHAVSPDLLTGVDCRIATSTGLKVRGIGTAVSRATITGGHVLQGSATAHLVRGESGRRLSWSHYLARPGRIELIGRPEPDDLARGFVGPRSQVAVLDLGAVARRAMKDVQSSPVLDRRPPFPAARTRLRFAVAMTGSDGQPHLHFRVEDKQLRTLQITCGAEQGPVVVEFCEDLALHDWLLTTLLHIMDGSRIGTEPRHAVVARLRPAVDHLLHLWMPGARIDESVAPFWERMERRPGMSRQWRACAERIRDQIALSAVTLLGSRLEEIAA